MDPKRKDSDQAGQRKVRGRGRGHKPHPAIPVGGIQESQPSGTEDRRPVTSEATTKIVPGRGRGRGHKRHPALPVIGLQESTSTEYEKLTIKEAAETASGESIQRRSLTLNTENVIHSSVTHEDRKETSVRALRSVFQEEHAVDFLSTAMKRLGLELTFNGSTRYNYAKRPGVGIKGKKINLFANYFPIDIPQGELFHYDVQIEKVVPETRKEDNSEEKVVSVRKNESINEGKPVHKKYRCQNTKINRNVIEKLIRDEAMFRNRRPAFDGRKNLYTRNPLPIKDTKVFTVKIADDFNPKIEVSYEIKIKPAESKDTAERSAKNSISLKPLHEVLAGNRSDITESIIMGMMAIETILRHGPALRLIPVGRSFFVKPQMGEIHPLGEGMEIWFGYHQSIHLSKWKPMLNIDKSATTFYKSCSVLNFMFETLFPDIRNVESFARQLRGLTDVERKILRKKMKDMKIVVTHLGYPRKYRVRDITRDNANNIIFMRKINNTEAPCSVSEYFCSEYGSLKYPNLPCLNVGRKEKDVFLPIEVCNIVEGQHCNEKLSKNQTSDMIRYMARPPAERFNDIRKSVNDMMRDFQPFSTEFHINVSLNMLKCTGRVLDPPNIMYDKSQNITPFNGSRAMKYKKFHTGVKIEKWMLLSFSTEPSCNQNTLNNFVRLLMNGGRSVGVDFEQPLAVRRFTCDNPGNIIRKAKEKEPELQLAIIVLPAEDIYSEVKTVAETELGLMTQCVRDVNTTGKKCNAQLINNLCQKINAKMGGINNSLSREDKPAIFNKPVMIVGIDCNHPAPSSEVKYSIAAVVGSLDSHPSKYKASIRVQHKKQKIDGQDYGQDIVIELKVMMKEVLLAFFNKTNGKKPEKIIVFRDGVSEGEFQKVMDYELREIRKACEEMAPGETYRPPITFIITGKRHHTRFLPENPRDGVVRPENVLPGTTVDTDVVHPVFYDFFLCSHFSIQGTSRPAHYTVLWDDNDFTADELQVLTFYLCHNYARCTRSISIPCPVMYADLVAYRAKQYLTNKTEGTSSSGSGASEREEIIIEECVKEAIKVVDKIENRMYFV
ncbi:protein argonaute-2-like [Centruroides sculpturatus]|uniref:protein argonaute-2-like n=1 Tax=Centruroides sculpturatus TaxID=218467 RepID=UPI000C6DB370|nr:protein argonaute-2-like [Centruroides sculpturatus]